MNSLHRVVGLITRTTTTYPISSRVSRSRSTLPSILADLMSTKSRNDALESARLPDDLTDKSRAPWETDVSFPSPKSTAAATACSSSEEIDAEAKAFVEDMDEHWDGIVVERKEGGETIYRWKTIVNLEEADKLGDSGSDGADVVDSLVITERGEYRFKFDKS